MFKTVLVPFVCCLGCFEMADDHSGSNSTSSNQYEASAKPVVLPKVISALVRITNDKFDGMHYAEWHKTTCMFLTGVEKKDHLTDESPTSRTAKDKWLWRIINCLA